MVVINTILTALYQKIPFIKEITASRKNVSFFNLKKLTIITIYANETEGL